MRTLVAGMLGGLMAVSPLYPATADAQAAPPAAPDAARSPIVLVPADLADLPPVVRRYFAFMGAIGRPPAWSMRSRFTGRFRLGLKGDWLPCEGRVENHRGGAYRFFEMRMTYLGFLPLLVEDFYRDGKGGLRARLLGFIPVAEGHGPELDVGELVTYLSEAVLGAPSMLLGPETTWHALDDDAFEVRLTDAGTTVTARVEVDERGAPTRFTTTDRYFIDPTDPKKPPARMRWSVPVAAWSTVDGRQVATDAQAVWEFPEGPYPYGELRTDPASVEFNAI